MFTAEEPIATPPQRVQTLVGAPHYPWQGLAAAMPLDVCCPSATRSTPCL